jgi:adenine-specific DNA-methyltransferase
MPPTPKDPKQIAAHTHPDARRTYIPTAEYAAVLDDDLTQPVQVAYARRNRDLDPQLVWRGKDDQDWSDLVVNAPPLYIHEKIHPKVLLDDLRRATAATESVATAAQLDLFADFNGVPADATATDFYQHDANWTNRLILGDSLQVMASLAEREGLRGKVQCIYLDPPYGIKFNSNFQWSTTSRDVKDGNRDHITREPEQVKAFRDTWRDGIHSYLTYLRDRLTVARDLLTDSGSIFVQIGDENVHRVRALMDEVFGPTNCIATISFWKTSSLGTSYLDSTYDHILWYAKDTESLKFRRLFREKIFGGEGASQYNYRMLAPGHFVRLDDYSSTTDRVFAHGDMRSQSSSSTTLFPIDYFGLSLSGPGKGGWKTNVEGMARLYRANRLIRIGDSIRYVRYFDDFPIFPITSRWDDTGVSGFGDPKLYVVQTIASAIQRCILMTTDPGDLVLDPTCGSGTTAYAAEQWGRRWITIDTSRVALALARARLMGARYPYYLLADSPAGQRKDAELSGKAPSTAPTYGNLRHGFVYSRVPHIMLKDIANNAEIDVIWAQFQAVMEPLRAQLNAALGQSWEEWQIPRAAEAGWPASAAQLHAAWWQERIARQQRIDASIAANADQELLYDQPHEDRSTVRVAGPFTVESLSPHRVLTVDADDELRTPDGRRIGAPTDPAAPPAPAADTFTQVILDHLQRAGVQQAHKEDRITFTALNGWPGRFICAEATYAEAATARTRRAAIFIGPEYGTVARPDLVEAAREAAEAGFDVLIACAFNYDAHAGDFDKLGRIPILKARMNADLHMAESLKNTGAGNLFVIFGEPDISIQPAGEGQLQVQIHGVDIFHPQKGEVVSGGPDDIAVWFIDTDYNEESFFVRHAYFLGANDPYSSLKSTLKAEIDEEAWASLRRAISRPFPRPASGRIAVKVINHLGDEVLKVYKV